MQTLKELEDHLDANGKPSDVWGFRRIETVLKMVKNARSVEARCCSSITMMIEPVYGKITKRQARDALRSFDDLSLQYLCKLDVGVLSLGGAAIGDE